VEELQLVGTKQICIEGIKNDSLCHLHDVPSAAYKWSTSETIQSKCIRIPESEKCFLIKLEDFLFKYYLSRFCRKSSYSNSGCH
jgi:hypothetical protein